MDSTPTFIGTTTETFPPATDTPPAPIDACVKWFDPARGFGFVIAERYSQDILLHANTLQNFGQSTVADGVRLKVHVQDAGGRLKVSRVLSIEAEMPAIRTPIAESTGLDRAAVERLSILPGRVKWLDRAEGYGFVNVFGCAEDVFLHQDVLRAGGVSGFSPGEGIALRMARGARGLMAVQVLAWDAGVTLDGACP